MLAGCELTRASDDWFFLGAAASLCVRGPHANATAPMHNIETITRELI
jgi:hypothetical protein